MIFWTGTKAGYLLFLVSTARVENICLSHETLKYASQSYRQGYVYFRKRRGTGVLRRLALMKPERIEVYTVISQFHPDFKHNKPDFVLPIVNEEDDIEGFPDSFAIKTENLELLRELIARGKKVSWLLPNLVKFSHIIAQLNFEHVFIDPFTENDLVFPTGEYKSGFFQKETLGKANEQMRMNRLVFAKMLGFNLVELSKLYDNVKYYQARKKKGKPINMKHMVGHFFAAAYYNILSITYMLCKKSFFATNVKKKPARKG